MSEISNTTPSNQIFTCKQIRATFDYTHKNLATYMDNLQKTCKLFGYKSLRPNQVDPIYTLLKGEDLLYVTATGGGKCEEPDTEILMSDMSVKKIKDIKVGDKVMSPSGVPRNVIGIHSGKDEMYKITYGYKQDKSFTVTADHKVPIAYRKWVKNKNTNEIITVEAKDLYKYSKHQRHQTAILTCNCLNLPKQEVDIDPYILGIWLGDGTASRPELTTQDNTVAECWINYSKSLNDDVRISIKKNNKAKTYRVIVNKDLHVRRPNLLTKFIRYNLINNKHIPNVYLNNDEYIRLQLLAGLLDTDGWVHRYQNADKTGYYEIIQKSNALANDIVLLATSLGFYVTRSIKNVKWHDGRILSYHRIKITGNDLERIPLKVGYKKAIKNKPSKYDWNRHAYSVDKIGLGDYVGIQIDGPDHLYLHADGSYSHNSMVYISTALAMGYKTVIFSPLISLIQDQANNLRKRGLNVGVLTSAVNAGEKKLALSLWENKELDFLFVAPERLQNKQFIEVMKKVPPDFIVVDEIHCAYEFAESFRSSYKRISPFIDEVAPKLFLGLTATMSKDVEESIRRTFNMPTIKKIANNYPRPNLHYYSYKPQGCINTELLSLINQEPLVPTIVYFSTVKLVEETYKLMARSIKGGCMAYTGKMANSARAANQDNFINGNIRVAFATNSFGMGVDKENVGKVIFRTMPGSIEELTQGFGRGGRNGCDCDCILVGDVDSLNTQYWFKDIQYPQKYDIERFYKALVSLREDGDIVNQTLSSICSTANIDPIYSTAIINILKGYNVVDREDRNSIAKIRFLDIPTENDTITKKYKLYYDNILLYGLETEGRYLAVDLELLAEEMGVSIQTIKNNLKAFSESDLIEYKAPGNQPLKIIGPIKNVDFNHIDFLRDQKEDKIKEVLKYFNLADDKKAQFLDDYFKQTNL